MSDKRATIAAQDRTILEASRRGDGWSEEEIAFLTDETNANETSEDVAYALNRTLYAVWAMRYALTHGREQCALDERVRVARSVAARSLPYDAGFTTIPEDWGPSTIA